MVGNGWGAGGGRGAARFAGPGGRDRPGAGASVREARGRPSSAAAFMSAAPADAGIVIRPMRRGDVEQVARLEREIFSDPWSGAVFAREARGEPGTWCRVAVSADGRVEGYLVAWLVADEVHLANVAVRPECRRHGLAQRFLDELEAEGRKRDARLVLLEVRRSNEEAQSLYRKNGFYIVSVRRRYYRDNHEDALVMIKPLTEAGRIPPERGLDR